MMETLGRYKNVLVLLAVLVAQFIALGVQVRTHAMGEADGRGVRLIRYGITAFMAPPEKAMVNTGSGVRGFWDNYIDLRHTRAENDALQDEVDRLRLEQASLLQDALQGQRLQALLAFKERYISRTTPAQVIGTGGSDQSRILYLDKGSHDGVAVDQPVITPDGIVGKVKDVFPHTSQVLAINDQTSGAGVLLEKTRLRGVLRGNAFGQPQIIDILPDERIKAGEHVVTSGGDQIYPRGLAVGVVEKVVADPDHEPYVDIVIKPAANLSHLEEVLVVTGTTDELPVSVQKDLAHSQAVGAIEIEKQRASDVLAEKLPGLNDPNAPPDEPVDETKAAATGEEPSRPIKPLPALHPDRFTPGAAPAAAHLTPGQPPVVIVSAARSQELAAAGATAVPKPRPRPAVTAADEDAGDAKESGSSGAAKSGLSASGTAKRAAAKSSVASTDETEPATTKPAAKLSTGEGTHPAVSLPTTERNGVPTTVVTDGPIVNPTTPYVEPKPVVRKPKPPIVDTPDAGPQN